MLVAADATGEPLRRVWGPVRPSAECGVLERAVTNAEEALRAALLAWARVVRAHAGLVLVLCGAITLALGVHAGRSLRVDSNTIELFPEHLPARRAHDSFVAEFPDLENALFVVIDGDDAELARDAAQRLEAALAAQPSHFSDAYVPAASRFFERTALLYRSVDELDELALQLVRMQPVLVSLERDPSVANLAELIERGLAEIEAGSRGASLDPKTWSDVLGRVGSATLAVYEEAPLRVSWQELLVRGSAVETSRRQVLVALPILDWDALLPAQAPLDLLRAEVARLGLTATRGVVVRVTGNPAIAHEETLGLLWDIGIAGIFCFGLVALILVRALRSLRLVVAMCTTLAAGLVWTAAFAATAIGALNVISIAAGILFVGLGVDFGIHLCMNYVERLSRGASHADAWDGALGDIGISLVVCALTTSVGFLAFLPTDYQGVAELGSITAAGLAFVLCLTFTLLPALLSWRPVDAAALRPAHFAFAPRFAISERAGATILCLAGLLAVGAVLLLPRLRFEPNIVAMRDPASESVRTFNDLLADPSAPSPWHANSVAPDLARAERLAREFAALSEVSRTLSLADYVPDAQQEKLAILAEAAFLLEPAPALAGPAAAGRGPREQIAALEKLRDVLRESRLDAPPGALAASVRDLEAKLTHFLERVAVEPSPAAAVAELERVLLSSLPGQMERFRQALEPSEVTIDSLPPRLVSRMLTDDGRARVLVFPSADLSDAAAFSRFVDQVRRVDAEVTGVAVNLVAFATTTLEAFRQAVASALGAIAVVLWLRWRRAADMLAALGPLLLAALLSAAAVALLEIPFSFFNVVVIPLIMGAGVDSAIHLVERSRSEGDGGKLIETTTARAVFYSALTTITSFGTLALSRHVGMSGLGVLLTIGMLLMLACNLVVLPALIQALRSPKGRRTPPSRRAPRSLVRFDRGPTPIGSRQKEAGSVATSARRPGVGR
jgi:hopanoid biosynthesis associated RND transporter like protein HpnN